jgi:hypothetical protein
MKKIQLLIAALLLSGGIMAQSTDEALRYSQQHFNGTARSAAMGGAFGALGGDFSSLSINPAGIGVYRSSEFTFSPSIELTKAKNSGITQDNYSFTIGNIGYVATFKPRLDKKEGWKNFNLGLGYNRMNNFNRESISRISNSSNSILDEWAINARGIPSDDLYNSSSIFYERLGYDAFLINPDENLNYQAALETGDIVDQERFLDEKGYIGEYLISFGANYNHKLYLGATIGIQDLFYESTSSYTEFAKRDNASPLQEFTFNEFYETSGIGVNFKFGAIYKPTNELRLGLAIHTPTFYDMESERSTSIISFFDPSRSDHPLYPSDGVAVHEFVSGDEENRRVYDFAEYNFETPFRAIASAAYLFKKRALISVDYEYINYSDAKYKDGPNGDNFYGRGDEMGINDEINSFYQTTGNLRVGAEYRVNSYLSLRGGFAHFGSPYKNFSEASYEQYSLGWGLKRNNFFFDMAYLYNTKDESYLFYPGSAVSKVEFQNHQMRMTFGFKF